MSLRDNAVVQVLGDRTAFWGRVARDSGLTGTTVALAGFVVAASSMHGAAMALWRSGLLAAYVAVKLPALLVGSTGIVALLNWIVASVLGSGLSLRQTVAVTYAAMAVACWILLGLLPVTLFFTLAAAPTHGPRAEVGLAHACLLLTQIVLLAMAGLWGTATLRQGLRSVVTPRCPVSALYWSWIGAFALVGCQLSWILRPFVGNPFLPVVFLRENCLEGNFFEFVFGHLVPTVLRGG